MSIDLTIRNNLLILYIAVIGEGVNAQKKKFTNFEDIAKMQLEMEKGREALTKRQHVFANIDSCLPFPTLLRFQQTDVLGNMIIPANIFCNVV